MYDIFGDEGYARFATILSQMVIATKGSPTYEVSIAGDDGLPDDPVFPKNLYCDIGGQNDNNETEYVKTLFVGSDLIYDTNISASFSGNKINLSATYTHREAVSGYGGTSEVEDDSYQIFGNPFDFVGIGYNCHCDGASNWWSFCYGKVLDFC